MPKSSNAQSKLFNFYLWSLMGVGAIFGPTNLAKASLIDDLIDTHIPPKVHIASNEWIANCSESLRRLDLNSGGSTVAMSQSIQKNHQFYLGDYSVSRDHGSLIAMTVESDGRIPKYYQTQLRERPSPKNAHQTQDHLIDLTEEFRGSSPSAPLSPISRQHLIPADALDHSELKTAGAYSLISKNTLHLLLTTSDDSGYRTLIRNFKFDAPIASVVTIDHSLSKSKDQIFVLLSDARLFVISAPAHAADGKIQKAEKQNEWVQKIDYSDYEKLRGQVDSKKLKLNRLDGAYTFHQMIKTKDSDPTFYNYTFTLLIRAQAPADQNSDDKTQVSHDIVVGQGVTSF